MIFCYPIGMINYIKQGRVVILMKLIASLIIVFLVGCASVPEKKENQLEKAATEKAKKQQEDADKKASVAKEKAKPTAISPEVLYLLMAAEIAGQRNQYDVALDGYLEAAKKVDDVKLAERAAKIGLFLKDTKKTDEAVALWLQRDEKNLTARKIAVLSALRGTDEALAVQQLNAILKEDPAGFESTLMEITKVLEKEGNTEFVYNALEQVAEQHKNQAVVYFVQALLAGQQKKTEIASRKVNKALEIQPGWNKALILRAQFAIQNNELKLARKDLEKALEKTPDNDRLKKMLAQVLVKDNELDEAIKVYQSILDGKPEDGDAQFAIALIYLQQEKDKEALKSFKTLVNKSQWDAPACFYIGRIEYKRKNYDQAIVWFDKVTKGGYSYDASLTAISVLMSQKKYKEAEERIGKVAKDFPKQKINTILLEAEIYNAEKKYQKAFDLLTVALKDYPDNKEILYTRALIAEKVDKLDVLESDLKKILAKTPDDANTLNALGYTLVDRTTRYEEAEKYLRKAIKLKPDEPVIMDSIGWLYFKQGKSVEALKHLRAAYSKQAESEIAAHLAEILLSMGKKEEAREVFEKAFSETPDDEYLLKVKHLFLK